MSSNLMKYSVLNTIQTYDEVSYPIKVIISKYKENKNKNLKEF